MGVHCDRLKLGPTKALHCQTSQNKDKLSKKYYNNKLKRLLGVKLHNKFKILCNND